MKIQLFHSKAEIRRHPNAINESISSRLRSNTEPAIAEIVQLFHATFPARESCDEESDLAYVSVHEDTNCNQGVQTNRQLSRRISRSTAV